MQLNIMIQNGIARHILNINDKLLLKWRTQVQRLIEKKKKRKRSRAEADREEEEARKRESGRLRVIKFRAKEKAHPERR